MVSSDYDRIFEPSKAFCIQKSFLFKGPDLIIQDRLMPFQEDNAFLPGEAPDLRCRQKFSGRTVKVQAAASVFPSPALSFRAFIYGCLPQKLGDIFLGSQVSPL